MGSTNALEPLSVMPFDLRCQSPLQEEYSNNSTTYGLNPTPVALSSAHLVARNHSSQKPLRATRISGCQLVMLSQSAFPSLMKASQHFRHPRRGRLDAFAYRFYRRGDPRSEPRQGMRDGFSGELPHRSAQARSIARRAASRRGPTQARYGREDAALALGDGWPAAPLVARSDRSQAASHEHSRPPPPAPGITSIYLPPPRDGRAHRPVPRVGRSHQGMGAMRTA